MFTVSFVCCTRDCNEYELYICTQCIFFYILIIGSSQPITFWFLNDEMCIPWLSNLFIVLILISDYSMYRCLLHECSCLSEKVEIPTKCVKSIESFDIVANVMFIDFEGRSDGESIRKILAQIKPRQLVSSRAAVVSADWWRPDMRSHTCMCQ